MKAFLTALLATVVIAIAVHFAFQRLAGQWNTATVRSEPFVRLDPRLMPSPDW